MTCPIKVIGNSISLDFSHNKFIFRVISHELCKHRRVIDDVRTYWQTTAERFFIPILSAETAKIN
jgi:hypothetical protein